MAINPYMYTYEIWRDRCIRYVYIYVYIYSTIDSR